MPTLSDTAQVIDSYTEQMQGSVAETFKEDEKDIRKRNMIRLALAFLVLSTFAYLIYKK